MADDISQRHKAAREREQARMTTGARTALHYSPRGKPEPKGHSLEGEPDIDTPVKGLGITPRDLAMHTRGKLGGPKDIDPHSVVREREYSRSARSMRGKR